jgi:elongation factor Ts
MSNISAADVAKLRKQTGAGMMDCKKALSESNGDFEGAIEYLRKKGQKMAANREDRDATEGCVLTGVSADGKKGFLLVLNCETDFVGKNADFVALAQSLLDTAIATDSCTKETLYEQSINGKKVSDLLIEQVGVMGEKIDVATVLTVVGEKIGTYIHSGNVRAGIVAFNKNIDDQICKDVAMQVVAMSPVSVDKADCPSDIVEKEIEIAKELLRNEGKPEAMLDKIAQGKLDKFFKENTLLNQDFIKGDKTTVAEYIKQADKDATVTSFKRYSLIV